MDKKSQHVGNHGGRYTDINGMSKQFTYIDHDQKTKIAVGKMSPEELNALNEEIKNHTEVEILKLLSLPAVNALKNEWGLYEEFIIRDPTKGIIWNEKAVRDNLNPDILRNLSMQVWRSTVKERYWFEDMSLEDIRIGKWQEWV